MAHGVRGKVIEHKYFGSERIVSDLKKIKGWERGHIVLKENSLIRCEKTTLIKGLNIAKNNQEISIWDIDRSLKINYIKIISQKSIYIN